MHCAAGARAERATSGYARPQPIRYPNISSFFHRAVAGWHPRNPVVTSCPLENARDKSARSAGRATNWHTAHASAAANKHSTLAERKYGQRGNIIVHDRRLEAQDRGRILDGQRKVTDSQEAGKEAKRPNVGSKRVLEANQALRTLHSHCPRHAVSLPCRHHNKKAHCDVHASKHCSSQQAKRTICKMYTRHKM